MNRNLLLCAALFLLVTAVTAGVVTYSYDSAGRLIAANYGAGKSATFQYDATGNLLRSADTLIVDSDNDGMDDAWELLHFMDLSRDGAGDFDQDGMSDLAEFLAGTLPNVSSSLLRLLQTVTNTLVQTTVNWQSISGKTYRVQFKNSLDDSGWNDLPGDVTATGATASKTDTTSIGQSQRFYRVQVVP